MTQWIILIMLTCASQYSRRDRMVEVAESIDAAAHAYPIDGDPVRTVAELVALARFEGNFNPDAVGQDKFGRSFGLFQLHETTIGHGDYITKAVGLEAYEAWSRAHPKVTVTDTTKPWLVISAVPSVELVLVPKVNAMIAARLLVQSHRVCAGRPMEERLGWYASGGPTCAVPEGLEASRARMRLAESFLSGERPAFWTAPRVEVEGVQAKRRG